MPSEHWLAYGDVKEALAFFLGGRLRATASLKLSEDPAQAGFQARWETLPSDRVSVSMWSRNLCLRA